MDAWLNTVVHCFSMDVDLLKHKKCLNDRVNVNVILHHKYTANTFFKKILKPLLTMTRLNINPTLI